MPIVEAHVLQGYSPEEKKRLVRALTDAIRFVVPAPDEAITVMLTNTRRRTMRAAGRRAQPAPALPDPAKLVLRLPRGDGGARSRHGAQAMLAAGSR
jgi:phenylpyruvate tautomerase PptA (4-oxalocrotonate tautomerase family)